LSPDQHDVLDVSQVEDLRGIDDGAMLARLVRMYLARTPERIKQLLAQVAAADFAAIARDAHTLKGASGSIGAARVAKVCTRIEQAAKAEDAKALEELAQALESEYARASHALRAFAGRGAT
jgi:HPt (histidine-containing phosphotransfer) domain-containing protein